MSKKTEKDVIERIKQKAKTLEEIKETIDPKRQEKLVKLSDVLAELKHEKIRKLGKDIKEFEKRAKELGIEADENIRKALENIREALDGD